MSALAPMSYGYPNHANTTFDVGRTTNLGLNQLLDAVDLTALTSQNSQQPPQHGLGQGFGGGLPQGHPQPQQPIIVMGDPISAEELAASGAIVQADGFVEEVVLVDPATGQVVQQGGQGTLGIQGIQGGGMLGIAGAGLPQTMGGGAPQFANIPFLPPDHSLNQLLSNAGMVLNDHRGILNQAGRPGGSPIPGLSPTMAAGLQQTNSFVSQAHRIAQGYIQDLKKSPKANQKKGDDKKKGGNEKAK
ncbi:MAG: hypothetical protein KTR14_05895 [Vampirovibrio sp.]|nr:hypothetical protein [Vampirovibrio sp.]